jgi:hypothetical protein
MAYSNVHKHWWTFATDGLHSSSPTLLATGLFLSYMFGRSLENSQGSVALLMTYTLACIGRARAGMCGASLCTICWAEAYSPAVYVPVLVCCMPGVIVPAQLQGWAQLQGRAGHSTRLQQVAAWPLSCVLWSCCTEISSTAPQQSLPQLLPHTSITQWHLKLRCPCLLYACCWRQAAALLVRYCCQSARYWRVLGWWELCLGCSVEPHCSTHTDPGTGSGWWSWWL